MDFILTNLPCSGRILIVADAVTEQAVSCIAESLFCFYCLKNVSDKHFVFCHALHP